MYPAAPLWATVLAGEGPASGIAVSPGATLPVAIIGGISLVVVALIPEFFRWLRRHAPEIPPASVTPDVLQAAESRIVLALEVKIATAVERANAARAEVRALRKGIEARDEAHRDEIREVRDLLNRFLWTRDSELPSPRESAE